MVNKHKLYSITLVSAAMILMLVNIVSAASFTYIANSNDNTVSVMDTSTNNVVATVSVGNNPVGLAVTPDGTAVYVANSGDNTVSVINSATNTVVATVPVGNQPYAVSVTQDGTSVDVANGDGTVSVIDTAIYTVT
jgi:YVTN family beta-propeller protein